MVFAELGSSHILTCTPLGILLHRNSSMMGLANKKTEKKKEVK
jgi:hypothetical protein